jgi:hypothetical protein
MTIIDKQNGRGLESTAAGKIWAGFGQQAHSDKENREPPPLLHR